MHAPPAVGHWNTFVDALEDVNDVGLYDCLTVHVPGPTNPPPAPHVSNAKLNGELRPVPDAIATE